jgi:protease I
MAFFFNSNRNKLKGKRVAILFTEGVEQVELTSPLKALRQAGAHVDLISPTGGKVKAWDMTDWGEKFKTNKSLAEARSGDYDALHLPGGAMNPDFLRQNKAAVAFVRSFFDAGRPVSAICHAPWMLIEADVVRGRKLTSWPSLHTDLRNAGATWVDESCVQDNNLVTSRGPQDLKTFNKHMIELFRTSGMSSSSKS